MDFTSNEFFILFCFYVGLITILAFCIFLFILLLRFFIKRISNKNTKPTIIYSNHKPKTRYKKQSEYIQACWDEIK